MARSSGGKIVTDGLVLALDGANIKSFRGEPTTNLVRNDRDFSGNAYANLNEYNTPTLNKTYESNISTPIGMGATLIEESGQYGYALLNRFGGGEIGNHSLSCYIYPISPITEFTQVAIGLMNDSSNTIYFNLNTNSISYGSGVINRNAFIETVPGWPGWYRIGGNHEGRNGGWVGSIGYGPGQYTGTAGNKKMYITGIQYELTEKPTHFIGAGQTRGATVATGGGWADLSGNTNHGELVNGVGYDSGNGGSLTFDGSNDGVYISHNSKLNISSDFTIEGWVWWNQHKNYSSLLVKGPGGSGGLFNYSFFFYETNIVVGFGNGTGYVTNGIGISNVPINKWHHILGTFDGFNLNFYINGNLINNVTTTAIPNQNSDNLNIIQTQYSIDGKVAIAKLYNRALTADEVLQNFNATRGRFGI